MFLPDTHDTDAECLRQLSGGNETAFEALYRKYSPGLYLRLLKILKSKNLAEDVLQDTFIIIWNSRKKIDFSKSFRSYVSCIAVNKCYDHFRKIGRERRFHDHFMKDHDKHVVYQQPFDQKEKKGLLFHMIELLPAKRKLIFTLCKIDGKSYVEVSKQLGISLSTISDHIVKANRFIRSGLFHLVD